MLLKLLFDFMLAIPRLVISIMPSVDFYFPQEALTYVSDMLYLVNYYLPVDGLIRLISLSLSIDMAHITWTVILKVKSFIPFLG